jgi:outer membrane protein TolC
MAAAAQAAATRYPQVISLNDPQFGAIVGPSSIASPDVETAYRFEISQAFPFPGKLELRGEAALNEAAAAGADLNETRLQLIEAARSALADYYLAARAVEVNEEGLKLLREFRDNANARYKTGQGEQQDVLQADVAIARQQERASTLERLRKVAQARINTLLNRTPDQVLPPPPKELASPAALPGASELRDLAIGQRPDIAALRSRLAADETAVALAIKEYYPDFEAMAAYDAFWQPRERDLRPMIGVRLNLPIQIARRNAALAEAEAKLAQRRAELARLIAQIGFQVQEAYEQVRETERSLKLYEETAIPKANENVRLARTAYANNKVPFFNLIEAQRNLVELREREFELRAEGRKRRAGLDRAIGSGLAIPPAPTPETLPPVFLPHPTPK